MYKLDLLYENGYETTYEKVWDIRIIDDELLIRQLESIFTIVIKIKEIKKIILYNGDITIFKLEK